MIGSKQFLLMKPTAYFINVARGPIVDQNALVEALQQGQIAGAGLDVTAPEPLEKDSPLWDMENVIISPHTSSNSPDLEISRMEIFKENLRRFLNDEPFIRVCNKLAGY